jgi:flagellar assembly protein FliH
MSEAEVHLWRAPEHVAGTRGASGPLTASRIAAIEEQAYAEGLERGLDEGRQRGAAEVAARAEALRQLIESIAPQTNVLDETLLAQLGELVLAIARQFVRRELGREPGEIVRVVREALTVLPLTEADIRVSLHPDDAALVVAELRPDTMAHPIKILEDLTLERGGARVETDVSVVDASIEARFGAIAATVFGDERRLDSESSDA